MLSFSLFSITIIRSTSFVFLLLCFQICKVKMSQENKKLVKWPRIMCKFSQLNWVIADILISKFLQLHLYETRHWDKHKQTNISRQETRRDEEGDQLQVGGNLDSWAFNLPYIISLIVKTKTNWEYEYPYQTQFCRVRVVLRFGAL